MPETDTQFHSLKTLNRLAFLRDENAPTISDEHLQVMKSLLSEMGSSALDGIDRLTTLDRLVETSGTTDSQVGNRLQAALGKMLDKTYETIHDEGIKGSFNSLSPFEKCSRFPEFLESDGILIARLLGGKPRRGRADSNNNVERVETSR